jgi:hypothetical protein
MILYGMLWFTANRHVQFVFQIFSRLAAEDGEQTIYLPWSARRLKTIFDKVVETKVPVNVATAFL